MINPVTVVRPADRRRVEWKNGAGVTEEIAEGSNPKGGGPTPRWRVSIADLGSAATEFSAFGGRHRVFTVIGSHGVQLTWDGGSAVLEPFQPFPFDGSVAPTCSPDGPTSAFNVMVDKTAGRATVTSRQLDSMGIETAPSMITVVYIARGNARTRDFEAGAGDCLVVENDAVELRGDAFVLVAELDLLNGQV